ncbi:hypothetical protein F4775DRAFT_607359 [Biscogniauxia sp. FL1348]|nr:hypothetical protein F4775DRAFT_607359 [Biscogniauxia sp. FL1348]
MAGDDQPSRKDADYAVATNATDSHDFAWNTCSDSHEQERIAVKEKALQDGLEHYERIADTLQRFPSISNLGAQHVESICSHDQRQKWIESCEEIKKRHKNFAVLVGVAGKTGSGKTSALNALLGYRELLPTSNDSAATSVVCKVSYNYDDRLAYAFRACVIFREKTDLLEQLEQFFEDLKGRNDLEAAHNGSIEDEDALRIANATLKTNLEMIYAVFGLEESEVENMSAQELISSNPDIDTLIGTQKWFHANEADILSEKIKPYMDSTSVAHATSGVEFAAWPLIDEVQIFVKSDILKNGVVLVDLPGIGDSVESRAAVAERYYTKLAATLIITPVSRAADESTAVKLMSEHHEMGMKLDGKYHKKNYCVVLSHIDQIDRAAALRKPDAKSNLELQGYIQREGELRAQRSEKDEEKKQATKKLRSLRKAEKSANAKIQKNIGPARVSKYIPRVHKNQAKKLKDEVTSQERYISDLEEALERLQEELKVISGKITFTCIKARNAFLKRRIGGDFERRQARMIASNRTDLRDTYDGQVSIHPISSKAFWPCFGKEKSNREEPLIGFPDVSYSGIPRLISWIRDATTPEREHHAELLLRDLHVCFNLIRLWSRDGWDQGKIGASRQWLQNDVFLPVYQSMKTSLDSHWRDLERSVKKLNPLTQTEDWRDRCAERVNDTVRKWRYKDPNSKTLSEKMHWLTYQANIQRRGKKFVSKGRTVHTYNWMEDITNILLDMILENWDGALNHDIPALASPTSKTIDSTWIKFLDGLVFNVEHTVPELMPYINEEMPSFESIKQKAKGQMCEALRGISKGASEIHPTSVKKIQEKWDKPFNDAIEATGTGSFRRRQGIMEDFAEGQGAKTLNAAFSSMNKKLERNFEQLPRILNRISDFVVQAVEAHINMLLDKVLESPADTVKLEDVAKVKIQLQQDIQSILLTWARQWMTPKEEYGIDLQVKDKEFPEEYRCIKTEGSDEDDAMETDEDNDGDEDPDNNVS